MSLTGCRRMKWIKYDATWFMAYELNDVDIATNAQLSMLNKSYS